MQNHPTTSKKEPKASSNNHLDANRRVLDILKSTRLTRYDNEFFVRANTQKNVSIDAAFLIAYNWKEITKMFLLTSISGLGFMAEKMCSQEDPEERTVHVLQTAFAILSDDLNNTYPTFKKVAPEGAKGAHYKWWEETILLPLKKLAKTKPMLAKGVQQLLTEMKNLSGKYMGTAVQLRIVETTALDIALAFLAVFSKVQYQGQKIFSDEDKLWITAHIEAETIHDQQVSNPLYGMTAIADSPEEQLEMFTLLKDYANAWNVALNEFSKFLEIP